MSDANEFLVEWVLRNVNIFPRFTKMIWLIHTQHTVVTQLPKVFLIEKL